MTNALYIGSLVCSTISGTGLAIAAVITAIFKGEVALIRARRGDPEPPIRVFTLPNILRRRS